MLCRYRGKSSHSNVCRSSGHHVPITIGFWLVQLSSNCSGSGPGCCCHVVSEHCRQSPSSHSSGHTCCDHWSCLGSSASKLCCRYRNWVRLCQIALHPLIWKLAFFCREELQKIAFRWHLVCWKSSFAIVASKRFGGCASPLSNVFHSKAKTSTSNSKRSHCCVLYHWQGCAGRLCKSGGVFKVG